MIYIFRGDDTVFAGSKFLTFSVKTGLNLTGWKAIFQLGAITKTVEDISDRIFEIELTHDETNQLWYGELFGSIKLMDNEGHIKTASNKIPFSVTNEVIENDYQVIDLSVPNSCEVDLFLTVSNPTSEGGGAVESVNGMTGHVILTATDVGAVETVNGRTGNVKLNAADVGALPNTTEIPTAVSQLQNDSQYITQTEVVGLIAQIPKFKIQIFGALPEQGEKMTLYLIPKDETNNDVFQEYIWIEDAQAFELLGSTAVDLSNYVTKAEFQALYDEFAVIRDMFLELIINNYPMTLAQYQSLEMSGNINPDKVYYIKEG